jgi:hypothetical protein
MSITPQLQASARAAYRTCFRATRVVFAGSFPSRPSPFPDFPPPSLPSLLISRLTHTSFRAPHRRCQCSPNLTPQAPLRVRNPPLNPKRLSRGVRRPGDHDQRGRRAAQEARRPGCQDDRGPGGLWCVSGHSFSFVANRLRPMSLPSGGWV